MYFLILKERQKRVYDISLFAGNLTAQLVSFVASFDIGYLVNYILEISWKYLLCLTNRKVTGIFLIGIYTYMYMSVPCEEENKIVQ